MPRRRRSSGLLIYGIVPPADLAKSVIDRYVTKAKDPKELEKWVSEYKGKVSKYAEDTRRQANAKSRLEVWYEIYLTDVYPKQKELYGVARAEYVRRVIKPLAATPP
jgi:hypothetical protein